MLMRLGAVKLLDFYWARNCIKIEAQKEQQLKLRNFQKN